MRKNKQADKPERCVVSVKKILVITLIFFMIMGTAGALASNDRVRNVQIILSNGYTMNVVTTSTNVSDILAENNILLLDGENVTPDIDEEISSNNTIRISKNTNKIVKVSDDTNDLNEVQGDESEDILEDEIKKSYTSIVEKVVTVQEEIPFETVTKDVSNNSEAKQDKVIQEGQNGIKEITYRIKYQNGTEIEKTKISEKVIQEPVDKIVEVRTKKTVTSRSSSSRTSTGKISGSVAEYQAYAKTLCKQKGWSDADFNSLVKLWNKESGWNPNARNASGAYGIPQSMHHSNSSAYKSSYQVQINWGVNYISSRYGTPSSAWSHSCKYNWY